MSSFSTARLDAERLQEEHFEWLCRLHQDPRVMATLGGVRSAEQTRAFLDKNLAHWQQHGYGLWLFKVKENGQFVGRGGLRQVSVGGSEERSWRMRSTRSFGARATRRKWPKRLQAESQRSTA